VTLEAPGDRLLILDAGTGIRLLGRALQARGTPLQADLLLTHTHWDHIHGLPFFYPAYQDATRLRIFGPRQERGLRSLIEHQMTWEMFPIPASAQVGIVDVVELDGAAFSAGGCEITGFRLSHPGVTLGYRIAPQGVRPFAYITDNELAGGAHGVTSSWRADLVNFLQGVDTLIHDSTWSDDPGVPIAGWGHSTARETVELARDAGCRRLVLFHHNPDHDDQAMDRLVAQARATADVIAPGLHVVAAIEGQTLELESPA
jgi:phosphoribosyl 1,2-cyclic phosphodiesterase